MKVKFLTMLANVILFLWAGSAQAQDVLPFPPTPSASQAGLTMKTSTYNKRVVV